MKTVAVYGISPMVRLRLKLLAVSRNQTMSTVVSELIEKAFDSDQTELSEPAKHKVKKIVRRWRP
ncbi:hypothetical protein ES703_18075 [subsurface metagenome]